MKSEEATSVRLAVLIESSEIYTFEESKGNTFCNFPANAMVQPHLFRQQVEQMDRGEENHRTEATVVTEIKFSLNDLICATR